MGMTDLQFKTFLRGLLSTLELALKESPDNEHIKKLIEMYTETLKS